MSYRDDLDAVRVRIESLEAEVQRLTVENEALQRARARLEARANRWEERVLAIGRRYVDAVIHAERGESADAILLATVERHLDLPDVAAFRREIAAVSTAIDPRQHDGLWTALDLAARE